MSKLNMALLQTTLFIVNVISLCFLNTTPFSIFITGMFFGVSFMAWANYIEYKILK